MVELLLQRGAPATVDAALKETASDRNSPKRRQQNSSAFRRAVTDAQGRTPEDLAAELLLADAVKAGLLSHEETAKLKMTHGKNELRDEEEILMRHLEILSKVEGALAAARGINNQSENDFLRAAIAIPTDRPLVWPCPSPAKVSSFFYLSVFLCLCLSISFSLSLSVK